MEKILVEVVLPAAGASYDIYIPLASPVSEVLYLIANLLNEKLMAITHLILCRLNRWI